VRLIVYVRSLKMAHKRFTECSQCFSR